MPFALSTRRYAPLLVALLPALLACSGEDDDNGNSDGVSSQGGRAGASGSSLDVGGRAGRSGAGQGGSAGEAGAAGLSGAAGEGGNAGQAGATGDAGQSGAAGAAGAVSSCGNGMLDPGEDCDGSLVVAQFCVNATSFQDAQFLSTPTCTACKLNKEECASCQDGKQNGAESDIDCGGGPGACAPCALGKNCDLDGQTPDEDCASGKCTDDNVCVPAFTDATATALAGVTISTFPTQLIAARFRTGASFDDLVFHDTQTLALKITKTDAQGAFSAPVTILSGVSAGAIVRAVQLGPDTILDLVVANAEPGMPSLQLLFGKGDGTFMQGGSLFTSDFEPITALAAGPLVPGGSVDLVVTTTKSVSFFRHVTDTSFGPHPTLPLEPQGGTPSGVAFVDGDDDGALDLFVTQSAGPLLMRRNDGKGVLAAPTVISTTNASNLGGILVGAFRPQDSRPSLLFPRATPRETFTIELASPTGNGIDASLFLPPALTTQAKPPKVVSADFEGAGGLDFLAYGASGNTEIWGNAGNGTFQPFDQGFQASELTVGQIRGSAAPEIVYVDGATGALRVLGNDAPTKP